MHSALSNELAAGQGRWHARLIQWRLIAASAWLLAAMATFGYSTYKSIVYGHQLLQIRLGEFGAQRPSGEFPLTLRKASPDLSVRTLSGAAERLRFGNRNALVLLYDDHCPACKDNMPRWLDLLTELRQRGLNVPVYALTLDTPEKQRAYWAGLGDAVALRQVTTSGDLFENFGTTSIPSTIVIRQGRVWSVYTGATGPWRRAYIARALSQ